MTSLSSAVFFLMLIMFMLLNLQRGVHTDDTGDVGDTGTYCFISNCTKDEDCRSQECPVCFVPSNICIPDYTSQTRGEDNITSEVI